MTPTAPTASPLTAPPAFAAICLPAFALQLLVRAQPEADRAAYAAGPTATVDIDKPEGRILAVDAAARAAGVLPGMRFGAALALAPTLRAGCVGDAEIQGAIEALRVLLRRFSPRVEAASEPPGLFWLDAAGLALLWPSASAWARATLQALQGEGWMASLALAPTRFGAAALAQMLALQPAASTAGPLCIARTAADERRVLREVPIATLDLAPKVRDALLKIGIDRLGALLDLPADGVRRRFGAEALQLWRMAAGDWRPALRPDPELVPIAGQRALDDEVDSTSAVLFLVKQGLPQLLQALQARHERLARLQVTLSLAPVWRGHAEAPVLADPRCARRLRRGDAGRLQAGGPSAAGAAGDGQAGREGQAGAGEGGVGARTGGAAVGGVDGDPAAERLCLEVVPAEPTLDEAVILDLLRLRLERLALPAAVIAVGLDAAGAPARHDQLGLGLHACRRDLRAAALAIARVRAELGDDNVLQPALGDGHLPEVRAAWCSARAVTAPQPRPARPEAEGERCLVRRLRHHALPLPPQPRHVRDDGWLVRGLDHGAVVRSVGPFVLDGGWWQDQPPQREYQLAELGHGEVLWIYFDRTSRRWMLQGAVE